MKTQNVYDPESPKKAVNLTANADLLRIAKDSGVNLSQLFEESLLAKVRSNIEEQWLEKNKEAINLYNERIERNGVFAAKNRRF